MPFCTFPNILPASSEAAYGFVAWREKSGGGPRHANRALRTAKTFFDALVFRSAPGGEVDTKISHPAA